MRKTYNDSPSRWQRVLWLATVALGGCGEQEGIVGRQHNPEPATASNVFESDFASNGDLWTVETSLPRASVTFGSADTRGRDGNVAELVFPGNSSATGNDNVGPNFVTQISTRDRFGFGTLRTRLNFGACAGAEEVVQAVLGYFNDGQDRDNNGITDDVEIDLQVTCGTPHVIYLSVFTDYQSTAAGTKFRKLSHIVDLSSGAEYDSASDDSDAYVPSGNNPTLTKPALATTNTFYEVGYEWHTGSVRFFLNDGTSDLTLWTLADAAHVPQEPVFIMYNLWHPDSHWFPMSGAAGFPSSDVVMKLDWVRFEPSAN